jgi:hypothetical protein
MKPLFVLARSALWWLVPLVALAALVAYETDFGQALRKTPPPPPPVEPKPVVSALLPEYAIEGGIAARRETVERTLFVPTRRPAPPLAVESAKPRMQRGQFALTGTLIVDGKNTAFLRETAGGRSRRVVQGDTVNGLVVADVQPDRIKLAMGDEVEELVLRVATNPRPTPQPPPVAAAPVPVPGQPVAAPGAPAAAAPPLTQDAVQSLAERRRAARAAQAAQMEAGQPGVAPQVPLPGMGGAVAPPAPATPPPAAPPTPRAEAGSGSWSDVYQRYQYRTR